MCSVAGMRVGHIARAYAAVWPEVSLMDKEPDTLLVVNRDRLIGPEGRARDNILRVHHIPHSRQVKTRKTATRSYYWKAMSMQLKA
jgi:hypothetical protein